MIRFDLALLALALGISSVACGGSPAPAKDPSAEPAASSSAPDGAPATPPAGPGLGLGGTGTPPAQGAGAAH
ncbi:MAG TPA: hypothetical protein VNW92_16710 [Polyangiaceae bacterium]|jgi:hypothetical protein|nr:hypothetical protein [Polyangiaceae bacterium]